MKKFLALLLSSAMLVSVLAACGGGSSSTAEPAGGSDDTAATDTASTDEDAGDADAGESTGGSGDYANGFDETVTIKIPIYERGWDGWNPTDNYWTRWIQEQMLETYNVDVEFVSIDRVNEVQDYSQLLAAHSAPDIILHYDMPQALAYRSEEVMQEIDYDEVATYAPTYWANLGDTNTQYGVVDGVNTFVFAERPLADNWARLIRKDWVEAAGYTMEDITSLEVLNEVVLAWQAAGINGTLSHELVQNNFNYDYEFMTFAPGSTEHALYMELGAANLPSEASYAFLKNLNYQYNNGILNPEFYLVTDDEAEKADFVSGRTATYNAYLFANTDVIDALLANEPDAELAFLPLSAITPEGNTSYSRGYWPFGMIMGINYETDELARIGVWLYLEWMSQPDVLFTLQNGFEGEHYELDPDGLPVSLEYDGEAALSQNNNKDYWALVVEAATYGSDELNERANRALWTPEGYEVLVDDLIADYNANEPYRVPDALFTVPIESLNIYKTDLNELWKQLYVQIIMTSEADFDAAYESAVETYLAAGYQEILDEKQAAIDAGNFS